MKWPWSKPKPVPAWYDYPGYIHLPPDKDVSIVQLDKTTQQDVIVRMDKGHVYIYTNKGTYLNHLLAEIHLCEVEVIR